MVDTYTPRLRLVVQEPFSNQNTWGNTFNAGVVDLVEQSIAGVTEIDLTSGNVTLTTMNGGADEARSMFLEFVGAPGAARQVIVPTLSKLYAVLNDCGQAVTVKTAAGTGVVIADGVVTLLFVDAINNIVRAIGRASGIAPATPLTDLVLTVNNRISGASSITAQWSRQGHLVTLRIPAHTTTTDSGAWTFSGSIPEEIIPNTQSPFIGVQIPAYVLGLAAGSKAALLVANTISFVGVSAVAFGAGPYQLLYDLTVTYSTRRP